MVNCCSKTLATFRQGFLHAFGCRRGGRKHGTSFSFHEATLFVSCALIDRVSTKGE
jgi:hypothetical protein